MSDQSAKKTLRELFVVKGQLYQAFQQLRNQPLERAPILDSNNIDTYFDNENFLAASGMYEVIYAILPIAQQNHEWSVIFYADHYEIVEETPIYLINFIMHQRNHYDYGEVYRKAMNLVVGGSMYKTPAAFFPFCLIPLISAKNRDCLWLNPEKIYDVHQQQSQTCVMMSNGVIFDSQIQKKSLEKNAKAGCIAHAVIHRDVRYEPIHSETPLQEYLAIPGTPLINRMLKRLKLSDLPGKRHDFFNAQYDLLREKILREAY